VALETFLLFGNLDSIVNKDKRSAISHVNFDCFADSTVTGIELFIINFGLHVDDPCDLLGLTRCRTLSDAAGAERRRSGRRGACRSSRTLRRVH
jgi:hypothetical protein